MTTRLKARNKNKFWRPNMSAMNFISRNGTTLEASRKRILITRGARVKRRAL
jgi:hypothetical protein